MRILFCVDTDQYLETLGKRLSEVLNLFNEEIYYLDILHVYQKPKADAPHMPSTILEIQKDEEKNRMHFLADCQHRLSEVLENRLKKAALVNSHLLQGKFTRKFREHIRFHRYEMVVLLPGKKDALDLFFTGGHVLKVIKNVSMPVLVLPKDSAFEFSKTVFLGMLEKPIKEYKKFQKSRVLSQLKVDALRYVHIGETEIEEALGIEVIKNSNRIEAFESFHEKRTENFIYVLNHKPGTGLRKWQKSSFTKAVLSKSNASIMVI